MTNLLTKGANALISASAKDGIIVRLSWNAPPDYEIDPCAFLLNAQHQVLNDDTMIFFNQPHSPDRAVNYHHDKHLFTLELNKLQSAIQKIAFSLTLYEGIERQQQFNKIQQAVIQIIKGTEEIARYVVSGNELQQETALIVGELYLHKAQWKFRAIGQGFNGGLAALCDHFGVNVAEEAVVSESKPEAKPEIQPTASTSSMPISLEKKLQHAPALLSLAKQARISLEKAKLTEHRAKVAICLDISASMRGLYKSGKIQQLTEKVLALGCQFDDDAQIDVFLFGKSAHRTASVGVNNFAHFTEEILLKYPLEAGTCYGKVMKRIRNFYFPVDIIANKPLVTKADLPVYVMFITDGNTSDTSETQRQMKGSSYEPIFWQFMAIGKSKKDVKHKGLLSALFESDFTFLESLHSLPDRYLDNSSFFSVEDPEQISNQQLYDLLMTDYPNWVKLATQKALLP